MKKELRFLVYLENKIKTSKDWGIYSLILFLPTFVICCMNYQKLFAFKALSIAVIAGLILIAWIGIVSVIIHFRTKKCKKIVKEIIKVFPVGKIIDKKLSEELKEKDEFLYSIGELYSENGIVKTSIEHNEDSCFAFNILLVFHKNESDDKHTSSFHCDELKSIKRLRDFLLN